MINLLTVIVAVIIFFIAVKCLCLYKSPLITHDISRENYKEISKKLKSGDLLFYVGEHNKIKKMYMLYRKQSEIMVVDIDSRGKIIYKDLPEIIKASNRYDVYILTLRSSLNSLQDRSLARLLSRNYGGFGDASCILKYNNKQYFFDCDAYIVNIMNSAGIINIGPQYDCLNNSDPRCLQQFSSTSIYLNGGLFNKDVYVIKDNDHNPAS